MTAPRRELRLSALALLAFQTVACSGTLDAGGDLDARLLPVGPENAVILCNDGASDNWQGEYAILLAQRATPRLTGLIVSTGGIWSNLDENMTAWQGLLTA